MKKAYPKYIETDIPWAMRIPEHWNVEKGKWLFKKESRPVRDEDEVITAFRDGEVTLRKNRREDGFTNALLEIGYQGIRKGDLVIHGMDAFAGAIGVSDSDGKSSPVYNVCTLKREGDAWYFCRAIREMSRAGFIQSLAKGIRERSTDFRFDTFGEQLLPLPPLPEQRQIAAFLDHKCALIDTFIQKKTRLIELLKEQKQAIINKAVTKGIDPNVRLKPSGIDWLGDIPEHWEVKKLKYDISVRGRVGWKALKASEYVSEGNIFLSTPNIKNYDIDFVNVDYINDFRFKESPELILEVGDILLTKDGSTTGTVNIVRHIPKPSTVNSSIAVLRPNSTFFSPFLFYFFQSDYIDKIVQNKMLGMGVPHLYQAEIKNFVLIKPPLEEQQAIVDYLEVERARLNNIMDKVIKEIGLLQEYKTTLIAEAVTGKIDVRDWKPKEFSSDMYVTRRQQPTPT